MALPWKLFDENKIDRGNVADGKQLGIDLLRLVSAPCSFRGPRHAQTAGPLEFDRLPAPLAQAPRLIGTALTRRLDLVWLGLDLAVLPLVPLVALVAMLWWASACGWLLVLRPCRW